MCEAVQYLTKFVLLMHKEHIGIVSYHTWLRRAIDCGRRTGTV